MTDVDALLALASVCVLATVAFVIVRRHEIPPRQRSVLSATYGLLAVTAAAALVLPGRQDLEIAHVMLSGAGVGVLALAAAAFPAAGAAVLALGAAGVAAAAASGLALETLALLLLPAALVANLVMRPTAPWRAAVLVGWTPAVVAVAVTELPARNTLEWPTWLLAALLAMLVFLMARTWRAPGMPRALVAGAVVAGGVLAVVAPLDLSVLVSVGVLAPAVAGFAFLRTRAAGAAIRPLACFAVAYATLFLVSLVSTSAAALAALASGLLSFVLLEAAWPELDAARARAHQLRRTAVPARGPIAPGDDVAGRYRVREQLGQGSFGCVFLAEDEVDGGTVVVKAAADERAVDASFLVEARALSEVRHPSIVELRDVIVEHGRVFLVMEHVEGGSLAARMAEQGALDVGRFSQLAEDILLALQAIHDTGLVHRDIKPTNVLLTREGRAKVGDFGIARRSIGDGTVGTLPLAMPVGTLRYMSPEQARGQPATVQGDLYSAAATLFEALTGRAYVRAIASESVVETQLRVASLGEFAEEVPGPERLRAWFARALAPSPGDRFPSAAQALDALRLACAAPH